MSGYPYPLFDQKGTGKERWMTEHYTDSNNDANLWPVALNVATEMHHAMVDAQFNLYTWWYIVRSYSPINNGAVTKRGWCMAHFSKFIRPGFYRVDATATPTPGVYVSAYRGDTDVVVVVVNTNTSTHSLTLSISGTKISSFDKFTTSSTKNLSNDGGVTTGANGSLTVTLDAESVTTLHGTGSVVPVDAGVVDSGAVPNSSTPDTGVLDSSVPPVDSRAVDATVSTSGGTTTSGGMTTSGGATTSGGTSTSGGDEGGVLLNDGGGPLQHAAAGASSGCSCSTARGRASGGSAVLLVGLMAVASRRRRTARVLL